MDIDFSAPTDASDQTSHITISRNFEIGERHSQGRVRQYVLYLGRSSRKISGIMLDPKCSVSGNMSIDNLFSILISPTSPNETMDQADSSKVDFRRLIAVLHMAHKFCFPDHEKWAKTLMEKYCLADGESGGLLGKCSIEISYPGFRVEKR